MILRRKHVPTRARSPLSLASASFVIVAALGQSVLAQSTFATIQGSVLDATGAAVANATVTVIDEGTGTKEAVQTGPAGDYRIFDLNAGTYTIVFSGSGFGDQSVPHEVILARQVVRLDGHLNAGSTRPRST